MNQKSILNKINIYKLITIIKEHSLKKNPPILELIKLQNNDKFKIFISVYLSSRTNDKTTINVCKNLFKRIKNFNDINNIPEENLKKLLYPVGFYNTKAKNLKKISRIIINEYNSKIPDNIEELLKLPGIGRKTANLILSRAFNKNLIAVDTHVHRISNRLGIVQTKNPEQTEKELYKVLPKELWKDYNFHIVAFGQTTCKSISPNCKSCPLNQFCPEFYKRTNKNNK